MDDYKIFEFEEEINKIVVFINNIEDLYYIQDDIYDSLSKTKGEKFSILVDLFLRNGFSFNRYVLIKFNNKRDYKSYIISPSEVSEKIKYNIKMYLKENKELLYDSALNKNVIEYVINK